MNFKSLMKKVSIVLICLMMFSFCFSNVVQAGNGKNGDGIGGKLLDPIVSLLVTLADGTYNLIHKTLMNQSESLIHVDLSMTAADILKVVGAVIVGILIAVAVVALIAWAAPFAAAAAGAVGSFVSGLGLTAAGTAISAAALSATQIIMISLGTGALGAISMYNHLPDAGEINLPVYSISPEEIFSNKVAIFDVDFFNPTGEEKKIEVDDGKGGKKTITKRIEKYKLANGETVELESTAGAMQETVATWYKRLRDIAIIAMLSILVYIGIRILISSTSNDKAKYKNMIMDWVIAMCLLFVMQYIMSFANIVIDKITDVVSASVGNNVYIAYIPKEDKVVDVLKEMGNTEDQINKITATFKDEDGKDRDYIMWKTNLTGRIRIAITDAKGAGITDYAGYTIMFIILIFYTVFFVFTYLKRVLYMAFLTIIAPLVAMTYPIDKINDGKAQAFDMWLKEYIFNLLIQPLHLLLYYILITSAFNLASQNIIYSLVALGFMIPAEKLMRKFFGFEKAHTPGLLAGPAGAAMMMNGMNALLKKGPSGSGKRSGSSGSGKEENENNKINQKDNIDTGEVFMPENVGENQEERNHNKNDVPINNDENESGLLNENYNNGTNGMDSSGYTLSNGIWLPDSNTTNNGTGNSYNKEENKELDDSGSKQYTEDKLSEYGKRDLEATKNQLGILPGTAYAAGVGTRKVASKVKNGVKTVAKKIPGAKPLVRGVKNSRAWEATKAASKFYARGMANKLTNKVRNMHPVKSGIRMAGGAALGSATAAIGLAAGIASGDPSKTFQYTTAAALGGYKLGSSATNKVEDNLNISGVKENFEKNYYGKEEYKERQIQKNIRMAQHDLELKQSLEDKLGKEEAKKYMSEAVPEYTRYGISDKKTIVAMAQMEKAGMDRKKAMSAALISDKYLKGKDSTSLGKKEEDEFKKTIKRDGEKRNLKGDSLDKFEKAQLEAIHKLDEMRFK